MSRIYCPECDDLVDRIYRPPYGSEEKGWMCEKCILDLCDMAHHWEWSEEDFKDEGIRRASE